MVAFGINVSNHFRATLVLDAIYATKGPAVAVADDEILADQRPPGSLEGWFICPQGAAAISAVWCLSDRRGTRS